jgi:hypothetical protein
MRTWLPAALACAQLHAAVIRGVVVENVSGRPLARSLVVLEPVAGTAGGPLSVRTNAYGSFEFAPLAAGAYLLTASRRSFATVEYGQKRWKAPGVPILLDEAASTFLTIRLPRFGAIAGTIVDENEVGISDYDVITYRNTRPPEIAGKARTDDRGMYRIFGLEPGSYLLRTVTKTFEDGGMYLPTFYRDAASVEDARTVDVMLDGQAGDVNVRPTPGRLLALGGKVSVPVAGRQAATVTLVSDMGSESVSSDSATNEFHFNPVAPGDYELYAEAPGDRFGPLAAFQQLHIEKDKTDVFLPLLAYPILSVAFMGAGEQPALSADITVMARRKELQGDGKPQKLRLANGSVTLQPGRWDLWLVPAEAWYAAEFRAPGPDGLIRRRGDGWNEVLLVSSGSQRVTGVRFVLSTSPGAVHGTVALSREPVPGAPVFLEPYDLEARKRLAGLRSTRTDMRGQYRFGGLAPGTYRLLSTFEYQMPDAAAMEEARPVSVDVKESRDGKVDLELYVIR